MSKQTRRMAAAASALAALVLAGCGNGSNDTSPASVAVTRPTALAGAATQAKAWNTAAIKQQQEERNKQTAGTQPAATQPLPDLGPKAVTLKDGLKYEDVTVGTGPAVKVGDTIVADYKGTFPDGTVFDSSMTAGHPLTTQLVPGQLIQGWIEGIPGMKAGGERKIAVPPDLGYGAAGMPPKIPPNANLVFDVQLRAIKAK